MNLLQRMFYRLWFKANPDTIYLDLRDALRQSHREMWVVNATPEADIHLSNINLAKDGAEPNYGNVRVNATWLPQPLHAQAPAWALMDSTTFCNAVLSGHIRVMHHRYAELTLLSENAQVEQRRLDAVKETIQAAQYHRQLRDEALRGVVVSAA